MALKEQDSNASAHVKSTTTPEGSTTKTLESGQTETLEMFPLSTEQICSVGDSRARTFRWQEKARGCPAKGLVFGGSLHESLRIASRDGSFWKTYQLSLIGDWERFSDAWPMAGTMRNGIVYQQVRLVPLTRETEYGLLPTPRASFGMAAPPSWVEKIKNPRGNLEEAIGGNINPPFVEWMMGFPLHWTLVE